MMSSILFSENEPRMNSTNQKRENNDASFALAPLAYSINGDFMSGSMISDKNNHE